MVMILGLSTAAAAVDLGLTTLVALFFLSYAFLAALAAAAAFYRQPARFLMYTLAPLW